MAVIGIALKNPANAYCDSVIPVSGTVEKSLTSVWPTS